jgi:hypothetical protein
MAITFNPFANGMSQTATLIWEDKQLFSWGLDFTTNRLVLVNGPSIPTTATVIWAFDPATGIITQTNGVYTVGLQVPQYTVATLPVSGQTKGQIVFTTDDNTFRVWNGTTFGGIAILPVSLTTGVSGILPIANGGTNAATAGAARTSLAVPGLGDNNTFTGINIFTGTVTFQNTATFQSTAILSAAQLQESQGADIASAATLTLGSDGNYFHVTGTTTITAISTTPKGTVIRLEFTGILTLTSNASIILGAGVNIITSAGMVIELVSEGAGVYRQISPVSTLTTGAAGAAVPGMYVPAIFF